MAPQDRSRDVVQGTLDILILKAVSLVGLVAVLATWIPARRASRGGSPYGVGR